MHLEDRKLRRYLRRLGKDAPGAMEIVAETLAAQGREYARDIITLVIYATPERGGYRRTRMLIRSIYSAVEKDEKGRLQVTVGASAEYALWNEMGTGDAGAAIGSNADEAAERILADAQASRQRLITLEYGNPGHGLEPRPFIIPALVMLQREAPAMIAEATERLARRG